MTAAPHAHALLAGQEARRVRDAHPELADGEVLLVYAAKDQAEAQELADALSTATTALRRRGSAVESILQALLPPGSLDVTHAVTAQVHREAEARLSLAEEFGLLSGARVAELASSRASNPSALASRWRKERRIFGVEAEGAIRYPGFQFDANGRPRPLVGKVMETFDDQLSPWELALWFTSANGWLGGIRPVDVLDSDPDTVLNAAGQLAGELGE